MSSLSYFMTVIAAALVQPVEGVGPSWPEYLRHRIVNERVFICDERRFVITSAEFRRIDHEPILPERITSIRVDGRIQSRDIERVSKFLGGVAGWSDVRLDCSDTGFALHVYGLDVPDQPQHDRDIGGPWNMEWRTVVWEDGHPTEMIVTPAGQVSAEH